VIFHEPAARRLRHVEHGAHVVLIGLRNSSLVEHDHVVLAFNHLAHRDILRGDKELMCVGIFRDLGWASLDKADAGLAGTVVELFISLGGRANVDVVDRDLCIRMHLLE